MSFACLLSSDRSRIILSNLFESAISSVLPPPILKEALAKLHGEFSRLRGTPSDFEILYTMRNVLFAPAARFQVQGISRPAADISICAIVGFDKIAALLWKMAQRERRLESIVGIITDPYAPKSSVARAAQVFNNASSRMPDLTLSDSDTIFWATPTSEYLRLMASCSPAGGNELAAFVRDKLGLVHLSAIAPKIGRHMFALRGRSTLADVGATVSFEFARPSTFDGFDNPRFRQRLPVPADPAECGITVDLHRGCFGPGAAELVLTPLSLSYFECEYLGELSVLPQGSDADYASSLCPSGDFDRLAAELNTIASS